MRQILALGSLWLIGLAVPCAGGVDDLARRMDEIRATPAERRWRNVPLESSFVVARKKAIAVNKPLFYFAADGVLDAGNC
jgi:hypothetical protein